MALPEDNEITDLAITTGEFRNLLNDTISDIAKGDTGYVATRSYVKGAVAIGSDYYRYISQVNGNLGNTPQLDDGSNWRLDDTVINLFSALYANGNQSVVGRLIAGVNVASHDYLVYADNDGYTVWLVGAETGTISGDFNKNTGIDSGLNGALVKVESITESRIKSIEDSQFTASTPTLYTVGVDRVLGGEYVNNTGRPIFVSVSVSGQNCTVIPTIDGNAFPSSSINGPSGSFSTALASVFVPNGSTYSFSNSSQGTLTAWSET